MSLSIPKSLATNDGIDRLKWRRPLQNGNERSGR